MKLTCRNQGEKTGSEAGSGSGDENGKRTSTLLLFFSSRWLSPSVSGRVRQFTVDSLQ